MKIARWAVTSICKTGLEMLCHIRKENWESVPCEGPLLAYANHTGAVEAPLMYTQMQPRPKVVALAKAQAWEHWLLGWVFNLWELIPVRRGEADMEAMRKSLEMLEKGYILGIAPEGTRSRSGALIRARGGIVLLGLKSRAPLLPVAHWGGESFESNLKKFKRTTFNIRVGRRFMLNDHNQQVTKEIRQKMADEMMYQLAKLLPEKYRGEYSDIENATEKYLRFVE